jgi:LAO/AO transport system kinase
MPPTPIDVEQLVAGNRRALARGITLVESTRGEDQAAAQALLEAVLPRTGNSFRIGVTGAPGVGKSTFIEAFGLHALRRGRRIAVLAVDPSSPMGGGSILGDKTRMEQLSRAADAFIRPSPAAAALGGVANKTREALLLCEAAGFDVIVVETVGVGQSEYEVASMVDLFLVLLSPGGGDELQGIKRGIVELADALLVNKKDSGMEELAERTRGQYQSALDLLRPPSFWKPRVLACSALHERGIDDVWSMVEEYFAEAGRGGHLQAKRTQQNAAWMKRLIHEIVEQRLNSDPAATELLPRLEREVLAGHTTPLAAARAVAAALGMRVRE